MLLIKDWVGDEESHLIIKFTDGTYICVRCRLWIYGCCDYILDNKYCPEIVDYHSYLMLILWGKFHLENYIERN